MFGARKLLRKLRSEFTEQHHHGGRGKTGHAGQVHTEDAVTFFPSVELRFVALRFLVTRFGRGHRRGGHVGFGIKRFEHRLDLRVTFGDQGLVL